MSYYFMTFNDAWFLNHKATFDHINKYIIIAPSVTTIDVKVDLYSDAKEWYKSGDNSKLADFPIRTTGGDPTSGGQRAGDIYFTQNNWRIVYDPTKVSVTGVLFSDDYDTPWLYERTLEPVYPAVVSSLVNTIAPVVNVDVGGISIPTAAENAAAVRAELTAELTQINAIDVNVGNMSLVIDDLLKYQGNKTLIDAGAYTMTIYDDDAVTPIKVFDLKDANGVASITSIFARIPR